MEKHIAMCQVNSQWDLLCDAGSSNPALCDELGGVGWGGRWEGALRGGGLMYICG